MIPKEMTAEVAGRNAIYAMMACNCYHDFKKTRFPIDKLDWILVDQTGDPIDHATKDGWFTGFAYDIYENSKTNKSVLAYRGTDSERDWELANLAIPFSIPYKSAIKALRLYIERNGARDITVVGHSLGGGLALSASVHQGVRAVTFDPSPRIFDGLGDFHLPAPRVIIFQKADILENIRQKLIHKAYDVVKEEDVFQCDYDFHGQNAHRIDILAMEMAKQGRLARPELDVVLGAMT